MTSIEFVAFLGLAFWVVVHLDRKRSWPSELRLDDPADEPGDVSVVAIVPARNEAEILPSTLPRLLDQDFSSFRVILVDDESNDGTAEVARRLGRTSRLEVIRPSGDRSGWTGKLRALASGVAHATSTADAPEWLLFTDADIRHRPGSVRALLAKARAEDRDLVSVMVRLRTETSWEKLLIPPFVYFFQFLYPFRRVADPGSRVAAAAGGCVLVRRETLERAGGLEAIRNELIDDVALGCAIKRAGGNVWLGLDPGIVSARPYHGLRDIWRMVARSAFHQLRYRWDLLVVVLGGILAVLVAPPILLAVSTSPALSGEAWAGRTFLLAASAWTLETLSFVPAVRHHRVAAPWALTLPAASFAYGLMTAGSAWDYMRGRSGSWKGRTYASAGRPQRF